MSRRPAERVPPDWVVPDNIYEGPHRIDELVAALKISQKLSLLPRWAALSDPIGFARRGLELAICDASTRQAAALAPAIKDWERISTLAGRAEFSLRQLLIGFNQWKPDRPEDIYLALRTSKAFKGAVADKEAEVRSAASILFAAVDIVEKLSLAADDQAKILLGQHAYDGDAPFRAFAIRIGETWAHLTGRAPAASKEGGPFMRFLEAAWYDAGGAIEGGTPGSATPFISGAVAAREVFTQSAVDQRIQQGALPW